MDRPSLYSSLFGNQTAELCLLYIANYGRGHIRGIARLFGIDPKTVKRQLEKLEADGIIVAQREGNIKLFQINPQLAIKCELSALLEKILFLLPNDQTEHYFRQRRRPRRTGKTL